MNNRIVSDTILEINSLLLKKYQAQQDIAQEMARIQKIKDLISDHSSDLQTKEISLSETKKNQLIKEKELDMLTQNLQRTKLNSTKVSSQKEQDAIEGELNKLQKQISLIEDQIFCLLDTIDSLQKDISEHKNFITGAIDSIATLEKEINSNVDRKNSEIDDYNKRVESLLSTLQKDIALDVNTAVKKFKGKQFVAFISNHICSMCHFKIERVTESAVERLITIEHCSNCERILLPTYL